MHVPCSFPSSLPRHAAAAKIVADAAAAAAAVAAAAAKAEAKAAAAAAALAAAPPKPKIARFQKSFFREEQLGECVHLCVCVNMQW